MKSTILVFGLLAIVGIVANKYPQWQEDRDWQRAASAAIASKFQSAEVWRGFSCTLRLNYSADGKIMFVGSDGPGSTFCDKASDAGLRAADAHIIPLAPARLRNYAVGADHWTDVDFSL